MARELKVFGMIIASFGGEAQRLGSRQHIRQIRAVVATTTKKEAIEKLGITATDARDHLGETGNEQEIKIAMSKPGQVFASAIDAYSDDKKYIEIERNPHVPVKRGKRESYEERAARWARQDAAREARKFTAEELEHLVDMLSGANHPLSASIAEKAKLRLSDLKAE